MGLFSFEEAAKELASFGLTGNQARAYVALAKLRVASVNKIAQLSKIRREEIYRMMPKLEKLGLVEKILGKPIRYKSAPPKEALSVLFKRERESAERKMAELAEKRRRLLKQLKSAKAKRAVEEESPNFALILDREQALRRIVKMVRKAKKSIAIATPMYAVQFGYTYADVFRKAVRKAVRVRIILDLDELNDFTFNILREAELFKDVVELRHTDNLTSHIVIIDDAEVIIGTFLRPTAEKHVDLWTNSSAYVGVMKAFFDKIWQDSVDAKSRIEYLQTGKPIERTWVFKEPKEAYEKSLELFRSAKKEIMGTGIPTRLSAYLRHYPFEELQKKGIKFRLLVPITKENVNEVKELSKYGELRHAGNINTVIGIIDREHLLFFRTPPPDTPRDSEYKEHFKEMVYTNDQRYLDGMMALVEHLWDMGVDGRERIMELETGKPIERTEVIKGRDAVYESILAVNSRAKVDKLGMVDGSAIGLVVREFASANIELKKRGVRVRYLTNVTDQNLQAAEELSKKFEARHVDIIPFGGLLTETEAIFSWMRQKDMPDAAIYSNNAELVDILWKVTENAWDNAMDAQSKIDEIREGESIGRVSEPMIGHLLRRTQRSR